MGDVSPTAPASLRVAGAQIENVVGDLEGNRRRILAAMRWAEDRDADVVVFPELALTGYPLADLVLREEFVDATIDAITRLAADSGRTAAVVGTVARVPPRRSWDTRDRSVAISAAMLCDGELRGNYHKMLLPNYEVFDEARNFAPGTRSDLLWRIGDVIAGVCICEDAWSGDGPPEAQAAAGAQILLVPNASPFHREKPSGRLALAAQVARRNGTPVVYVNSVGGQDELVFDGGSLIVDADGEVLHRAAQFTPERFCVDVPIGRSRRLTVPASTVHLRPRAQRPASLRPAPAPQMTTDEQVWQALVVGTRDFVRRNGAQGAALGLSGGIDSVLTALVAADALGPENVLAIAMPGPQSSSEELEDATSFAAHLGLDFQVIPIEATTTALRRDLAPLLERHPGAETRVALESRMRAAILWAACDELGHIPLATGNKTELSIGTAALYGDMAGSFAPLKDCPKTLLYALARWRNVRDAVIPERVFARPATVQRASSNTLPGYGVLDEIIDRYVEKGETLDHLASTGVDPVLPSLPMSPETLMTKESLRFEGENGALDVGCGDEWGWRRSRDPGSRRRAGFRDRRARLVGGGA